MPTPGVPKSERRRLDSWKAIAAYLSRDVTTVRRWEKHEGLPVHRHRHVKLGSVHAFTNEIDEWWHNRTLAGPADPTNAPLTAAKDSPASPAAALVSLAVIVVLTGGPAFQIARGGGAVRPAAMRFAVTPPPGVIVESFAISPDGRRAAFAARGPNGVGLWTHDFDSTTSDLLPGTSGASFPFWSADGHQVAFFAEGRLKRISLTTRETRDLAAAPFGLGGAWNAQGDIIFAADRGAPLMRTSAETGGVTAVTSLGSGYREGHAWPFFLPDGRRILYTDYCADGRRYGVYLKDLQTGTTTRLVAAYSNAAYSPDGFLLYVANNGSLVARHLDLDRMALSAAPIAVADRVLQFGDAAFHGDFSVSREGIIAARSAAEERNRLIWADRSGRQIGTIGDGGDLSNPALSSDGKTVAATVELGGRSRLWVFDAGTGAGRPLTDGRIDYAPLWSSHDRLLFLSVGQKGPAVTERALTGDRDAAVPSAPRAVALESRSRDGRFVTFSRVDANTKFDIWAWRAGDDQTAFPVLAGPANEGQSQLSPDGKFLAYASDESGRFEIYVRSFPDSTWSWRVSLAGGNDPRWRSDGRELFFIGADRKLMAVPISRGTPFRTGTPTPLFDTGVEVLWQDTRNHYDVTADGRRFVLLVPERDRRTAPFSVIVSQPR